MKRLARCCTVILFTAISTAVFGQSIKPIQFTDTKLANGLRVIISEDHYAPVFAIAVSYRVGSKDERAGRTGFAHLFEHMMFKGSENVGPGEHFFLIFNYGGSMNGTTNTDRTLYYETLPTNQLDLALFLESDRMRSLAVTEDNLENQRQAVQEERRLRLDDQAYGKSGERMNELAFDNFAYKHSVIGSMQDLNAASVLDVRAFFRTYYAPNNAVLALVGDIDAKDTLAKVQKYFGDIPRQEAPKPVDLSEPEMKAERRESMEDQLARLARVVMAYKIPAATNPDASALSALASILGGGDSSRLYQTLVKDKELCSGIGAGSGARMGPGLLQITCTVRPGKTMQEVEAVISSEILKLQNTSVTEAELKRVRTSARRNAVALRENALARAQQLADSAAMYDDPNRINTTTEKLLAVSAADVQRVAKTYLRDTNRIVFETIPTAPGAATAPRPSQR
jgi:zinc protease